MALLGLRLRIIFSISSTEILTVDKHLSVRQLRLVERLILLVIREHCRKKTIEKFGLLLEAYYEAIFVK